MSHSGGASPSDVQMLVYGIGGDNAVQGTPVEAQNASVWVASPTAGEARCFSGPFLSSGGHLYPTE